MNATTEYKKLADLQTNQRGIITRVAGRGAFRKRLIEMGFVKGKEIFVVKNAPLKDPIEYKIMGYEVSLRRSEARLIEVVAPEQAPEANLNLYNGVWASESFRQAVDDHSRTLRLALVGNPNCGKTTLFNELTGSHEHVGNYSGVTVDAKKATLRYKGYRFLLTDLPGTYSITAYSPEELFVRNYILNEMPDVVLNVLDASNLERNLFLTTQLIDMDLKVIAALNMYDELKKKGDRFRHLELGAMIGIPMVPTVGARRVGLTDLLDKAIEVFEDRSPVQRHIHIHYGAEIEASIQRLQRSLRLDTPLPNEVSSRFQAIQLLQRDQATLDILQGHPHLAQVMQTLDGELTRLRQIYQEEPESVISDAKYGFISGALRETYLPNRTERVRKTQRIDHYITHRLWGFPIFILFMWVMFQSTFSLGAIPMDAIEAGVGLLGDAIGQWMPPGVLKDLLVDGIVGGVGGVIVFLPNILILFFFISLMEDTGYMARAAFIMDKIMHRVGLHGKSFIPLVMGFGCNVPAIMATRTLENRNDRLLTMLINPFMSCSARLPVYVLLIAAIFPQRPGMVLFSLYVLGIVLAGLVAILFKKTLFRSVEAPFVMELPPYRIPTLKTTLRHMWTKAVQYLQKMGGVILVASILIWALGYYPKQSPRTPQYDQQVAQVQEQLANTAPSDSLGLAQLTAQLQQLSLDRQADRQANSYIGRLGKAVQPIFQPLGFDWKMTISIITGMAAKEIVVSTMGVLYQADQAADEQSESLIQKLRQQRVATGPERGAVLFSPVRAYAFLVFILIYFPCVAVIAAVRKESGSWRWAAFLAGYTTALAWVLAFAIYQIGSWWS